MKKLMELRKEVDDGDGVLNVFYLKLMQFWMMVDLLPDLLMVRKRWLTDMVTEYHSGVRLHPLKS